MTLLLRPGQLAGRGVAAAVLPRLLRPRRWVVRAPVAVVLRRRLGRLRRAGRVVLPVRA
jgi:hypothetical protein